MSKLSDRIRKASQTEHAPMGFAAMARAPTPTLLCIVSLAENEASKAAEAAEKGADAVIMERAEGKVSEQAKKASGLAIGVSMQEAERKDVAKLREAGADFVVLDFSSTLAEALLERKIGVVLGLSSEIDDTTLRLLGDLGLDALVVPAPRVPLTIESLLRLRRIASLGRTPLLLETDVDVDGTRLHALRESGVAGVIVGASSIGKLSRLRETIAALPARGLRREEHAEATLPSPALVGASSDDYDDDD